MDLIAILSTVILLVTVGTIMVALAAYGAVKVRDKRKPKPGRAASTDEAAVFQPEFLQRYMPPASGGEAAAETATATEAAPLTVAAQASSSVS